MGKLLFFGKPRIAAQTGPCKGIFAEIQLGKDLKNAERVISSLAVIANKVLIPKLTSPRSILPMWLRLTPAA